MPGTVELGRWSGSRGAALSRPDTPRTLPDSAEGTETAVLFARSWYGPALTEDVARYSRSVVRNAASMTEALAVART